MHTDEYEISLLRELNACNNSIQRIRKTLDLLERKHGKTTDQFIDELKSATLPIPPELKGDYEVWQGTYASLNMWKELERQYQEAFQMMKISQ